MKKLITLILLLNIIFLSSCWDMREINQIGFVMAVGVDKAEDSNEFITTVQIANPKPVAASRESSNNTASEPYWVYTAKGKTIFEAVRELSQLSSKRIVWAHNNIVIIGESLARENISSVIDFFTHNPELRMKTTVVVSKGNAKDYVGSKAGMEDVPGLSLSLMASASKLTAEYLKGDMLYLSQEYFSEHKQPVLSVISFKKEKIIPSESKSDKIIETVEIGGSAVFNKEKMIGMLSAEQSRGFAWVFNKTENTLVIVKQPNQNNRYVSVETSGVKSKIKVTIKNGIPELTIKISGKGSIVEEDGTTNMSINEFKKAIGELASKKIIEEVQSTLNIVQKELKIDAFSFAHVIYSHNKKQWGKISDKWESIYPDIKITVTADIKIISSTLNQIPAYEPKKKAS